MPTQMQLKITFAHKANWIFGTKINKYLIMNQLLRNKIISENEDPEKKKEVEENLSILKEGNIETGN